VRERVVVVVVVVVVIVIAEVFAIPPAGVIEPPVTPEVNIRAVSPLASLPRIRIRIRTSPEARSAFR